MKADEVLLVLLAVEETPRGPLLSQGSPGVAAFSVDISN